MTMTLAQRIQQLSPQQRTRLWERLNGGGTRTAAATREPDRQNSPAISGAPVSAGDASNQLVAYVMLRPGRSATDAELKEFLRSELLEFMVPNRFVFLESLPLTPNGKVDRNALPAPGTEPQKSVAFVSPRSETETRLAAMWSDVLGLPQVSVQDDFFQLGGHSLLALQVMGRVRETFKADLPLRTLFDFPTVAGLAVAIDRAPRSGAAEPIRKVARGDAAERRPFPRQS